MLNRSFCHIPSIGQATESKIWKSQISDFKDFISSPPVFLSGNKKKLILQHIKITKEKIVLKDLSYFMQNLPSCEHWRVFKEFRGCVAYLDIETTGLSDFQNTITTISLFDGKNIKYYVNGINLNDFKEDIKDYELLITYNGKTFDIPFIEKFFQIRLRHAHLDLRYILKSLGYSGGLKSCEKQLDIGRQGSVADVDGFFAVLLWSDYQKTGNIKSLETLLSYNIEDVLNLEYLMVEAYNQKIEKFCVNAELIPKPVKPENPFNTDEVTINRIKDENRGFSGYY